MLNEPIGNTATHHNSYKHDDAEHECIAAGESKLGDGLVKTECGHRRREQDEIQSTKRREDAERQSQVRVRDGQ